jgi:nitroimidazol reductase NimA-like FMN-containing flavoprotein (pyridoxamine 5'-phosphate oxidase superfamily)
VTTALESRVPDVLTDAECLRLLGTRGVGRLAFTDGALPAILPMPYAVHDGSLIIPARRDSEVAHAIRGSVVAFAVDCYDRSSGTGWGVTVVGPSRVVSAPAEVAALDALHAGTRPASGERVYIVVPLGLLKGWRTADPCEEHMAIAGHRVGHAPV